jgi:hypothetical protein
LNFGTRFAKTSVRGITAMHSIDDEHPGSDTFEEWKRQTRFIELRRTHGQVPGLLYAVNHALRYTKLRVLEVDSAPLPARGRDR